MKYGYAHVSKDGQNPATQLAALKAVGCGQTFIDEGVSGVLFKHLPCCVAPADTSRRRRLLADRLADQAPQRGRRAAVGRARLRLEGFGQLGRDPRREKFLAISAAHGRRL